MALRLLLTAGMWKHDQTTSQARPDSQPARRAQAAISFRSFQSTDTTEIVKLLGVGRPAGYVDAKSAIFDWQFCQNPHSDGRSPFLVGTIADGTIIALNGFMPARIRLHHQPLLACWGCDTYVAPAYRGQGFGKELVKRTSITAPIRLAYGISDMHDSILRKYDWRLHPHVVLLFYHVAERGISGQLKNLGSRLMRSRDDRRRARSRGVRGEDHARFSAEVDELWDAHRSGYTSAVERDAAYLNWKYHRHPLHRYITYSARSGGRLHGLLIARHDPDESVIADYCGPAEDSQLMCDLASAAVADLARRRTTRIRCETTHPPMIDALGRAGFLPSRHPSRFRVRSNLPVFGGTDVLDGWFLMTGDSDNDMLSGTGPI